MLKELEEFKKATKNLLEAWSDHSLNHYTLSILEKDYPLNGDLNDLEIEIEDWVDNSIKRLKQAATLKFVLLKKLLEGDDRFVTKDVYVASIVTSQDPIFISDFLGLSDTHEIDSEELQDMFFEIPSEAMMQLVNLNKEGRKEEYQNLINYLYKLMIGDE